MFGENIVHGGYELDYCQQGDLGQKLQDLICRNLSRDSGLMLTYSIKSARSLGDGRFEYLFFFEDKEGQDEGASGAMANVLAVDGDSMCDYVKSEFPELRRVEFEVREGGCLAVICTLDEMVDSLEMGEGERVGNLARLKVGELEERSREIQLALRVKGQQLVDGFGIDSVVCESVTLGGKQHRFVVNCGGVHPTGYKRSELVRAVIAKRGYDERGFSNLGGNIRITFYVDANVLDGPEVAGIAKEVTGAVYGWWKIH